MKKYILLSLLIMGYKEVAAMKRLIQPSVQQITFAQRYLSAFHPPENYYFLNVPSDYFLYPNKPMNGRSFFQKYLTIILFTLLKQTK